MLGLHPSHGVGFNLNRGVVGHSHSFCTTITLAYLAGRSALWTAESEAGLAFTFLLQYYADDSEHESVGVASPCSLRNAGVVFRKRALPLVFGEPIALAVA